MPLLSEQLPSRRQGHFRTAPPGGDRDLTSPFTANTLAAVREWVGAFGGGLAHTRQWVDAMKELKVDLDYVEQPGISHGPVIETGLKPIYEFFAQHHKL